jgi:hypothetical protein
MDTELLDRKNIDAFIFNYYKHSKLKYSYKWILLDNKQTLIITVKSTFICETLILKKNLMNQFEIITKLFLD